MKLRTNRQMYPIVFLSVLPVEKRPPVLPLFACVLLVEKSPPAPDFESFDWEPVENNPPPVVLLPMVVENSPPPAVPSLSFFFSLPKLLKSPPLVPLLSLLFVVVENKEFVLFVVAVHENSPLVGFASPPEPGVDPLENKPPLDDSFRPFAVFPRLNKPPPSVDGSLALFVPAAVENKPPLAALVPSDDKLFPAVVLKRPPEADVAVFFAVTVENKPSLDIFSLFPPENSPPPPESF